jgi:hypothetical protein
MNTTEKDPVRFSPQAEAVCLTYAQAIERYQTQFVAQSNRIMVQYSHAPTFETGPFCFYRGLQPPHS